MSIKGQISHKQNSLESPALATFTSQQETASKIDSVKREWIRHGLHEEVPDIFSKSVTESCIKWPYGTKLCSASPDLCHRRPADY